MTDLAGHARRHRSASTAALVWRNFTRNPSAIIGAILVLTVGLSALLAPAIAPYDPLAFSRDRLQGPTTAHPLGTDLYGRDTFSRVLYGTRTSLAVAGASVGVALLIGGLMGFISGYALGWTDMIIMRFTDVLLAFPAILLAIALLAYLGPGFWNLTMAIAIVYIAPFARVARAAVLTVRGEAYVEASRALGARDARIMAWHVLPNAISPVIVEVTLRLAFAILAEAALSFLGLGTQPPAPSWGQMIADGRAILERAPWASIGPGLAIMVAVLGFNLLGDGLRDALDPRLRER